MSKPRVALNDAAKRRLLFKRCGGNGRRTAAPDGYGSIHKKTGYRHIFVNGKIQLEHRVIWEAVYGRVPERLEIHHKNGNKLDNDISNLELVDPSTHQRLHAGWRIVDGEWIKPCTGCGGVYPLGNYHAQRSGIRSRCKQCCIKKKTEWRVRNTSGQIG